MVVTQVKKSYKKLVLNLASKYNYDKKHSAFVEKTALKLFDSLKEIHGFSQGERNLLRDACILHDIGNFISEKKHNKHTKYIIEKDEFLSDYPENDRSSLSLIAYNHRKKIHKDTLLLPKKDREIVLMLSAILRVADSLDYTREKISIKAINVLDSKIVITLEGVLPERLNSRLCEKKDLFIDVFKMDIELQN